MKTKLLFTVAMIGIFLMPNFVYAEEERLCEPGVYVFFGNGVWNDKEQAEYSRRLLTRLLESHVAGTDLDGKINYSTAHNPSQGTLLDLLETFEQNIQTNFTQFWRALAGLDPMPDFLQDKLKEIANTVDQSIVQLNPAVMDHVGKYNKLLSEGNKVVVVAHSQGNLFANIAYGGIPVDYKNGFGIVSVGNPDDYVAGRGEYTTIDEDIIIGSVPRSLNANLDNFFGINWRDLTGHMFGKSYMASGHPAQTKILDDTVQTINRLAGLANPLGTGIITATLTWGSNPDLDLHVYEPDGTHVFYQNYIGSSGYLDLDDVNGFGPEHYFVSCETLQPGMYSFGVNYYVGNSSEIGTLTIQAGDQILSRQEVFGEWYEEEGDLAPVILFRLEIKGSKEEGYEFEIK